MDVKVVVLDLDGTLTPARKSSRDPFVRDLLPGVLQKACDLSLAHTPVVILTNQRHADDGDVDDQLQWLRAFVPWTYALKMRGDACKPSPGGLSIIMGRFKVAPQEVLMVGDSLDDWYAARNAGCRFEWADNYFGRRGKRGS